MVATTAMKTKIITFLLLPLMLDMLVACCDCDDPEKHIYTIDNLSIRSIDNRGSQPVEIDAGTVPKNAYGIKVRLPLRMVAYNRPAIRPLFSTAAYATSCGCPPSLVYSPTDSIVSFKVVTLNNFDNQHPAGADVTSLFQVFKASNRSYQSIANYLASDAPVYNHKLDENVELTLLLMQAPAEGQHQFHIEIKLSDNRLLSGSTSIITLQ